jgi:hypothetical protein
MKNEKALVLTQLLASGSDVFVFVKPSKATQLPKHLLDEEYLMLHLGYNLSPIPMRDLYIGEGGLTVTLSFNQTPFACVLFWPEVFGMMMRGGMGRVWSDDMPKRMQEASEPFGAEPTQVTCVKSTKRTLPKGWSVINGGEPEGAA